MPELSRTETGEPGRRMPRKVDLGRSYASTMIAPMMQWREHRANPGGENRHGLRTVMGFNLPPWQRPLVWTDAQKLAFIESAWRGVSLGTYTYNQTEMGSRLDNLLIDGQQRMSAIESYLNDEFPVLGWRWSEVTAVDRRIWEMSTMFHSFVTSTEDEDYLMGYYNLMNFGGTAHREEDRAPLPSSHRGAE